jgi:putative membrane protein
MLTDVLLAIFHHLLTFALLGLLITEMVAIRPTMTSRDVLYVARLDVAYGITAGLIIVIGFCRVFFGIKGPEFYLPNPIFWAKMAAFLIVGLLSLPPTLRIIGWRKLAAGNPDYHPPAEEVRAARRFMHYEGMVFFTIPVFAALMARGYGL